MLNAGSAYAEDFSVHLDHMADIDAERAMPDYKLDKVLTRSYVGTFDLPEKRYQVFIRFKKFGDIVLGEANTGGPSTGKHWPKGKVFNSGVDVASVKAGWIKDAPDLFIVAWVNESDSRGLHLSFPHHCAIMRLKDGQADVLIRRNWWGSVRTSYFTYDRASTTSRFSFDPKQSRLTEQITRWTELASRDRQLLSYPRKDEGGNKYFMASIREKVIIRYKYADDGITLITCTLTYETQAQDKLSDIARFYLGPLGPRRAILDVNPDLAAKYKDQHPGAFIYLPAGIKIRIPVPQEWLVNRYCRWLKAPKPRDADAPKPAG